MNQFFTNSRYNVGIPLLLLSVVLAITVDSATFWWMVAFFILSMLISILQTQWGFYLQGKQTRWRAVGTTLVFMLIATPIVMGCAWLGYNWLPDLFERLLTG